MLNHTRLSCWRILHPFFSIFVENLFSAFDSFLADMFLFCCCGERVETDTETDAQEIVRDENDPVIIEPLPDAATLHLAHSNALNEKSLDKAASQNWETFDDVTTTNFQVNFFDFGCYIRFKLKIHKVVCHVIFLSALSKMENRNFGAEVSRED